MAKPDRAFYELLVETFGLVPQETLYIEDNLVNLQAAAEKGFVAHHFVSSVALGADLLRYGLIDMGAR